MSSDELDQRLVEEIKHAYGGAVDGWASGPTPLYRRLAQALVDASPVALADRDVLDLGAGTGVASAVLREVGARPVGVDIAWQMLRHRASQRPPGVAGAAQALPFRAGAFDAVVAAFCLNHLPDPSAGLAECRRVTRPGGVVLASTFPADAEHPAKAIVETTLEEFGYRRPHWYQTFKERIAALTGDADALARAAIDGGLIDVEVVRRDVEAGVDRPELAVEWRLNMPHTLEFVAALDPTSVAALRSRAATSLSDDLPSTVPILVLTATVP